MRSGLWVLVGFIVLLPVIAFSADVPGAPFQTLQQQIDTLNVKVNALQQQIDTTNAKLNTLFNQACPEGQFVVGISATGSILCEGLPQPPQPEGTIYMMDCGAGADPFDSLYANFELEFAPELIGQKITAIAVEIEFVPGITAIGGSSAYVELKSVATGTVLATSRVMPIPPLGWVEFAFTPGFLIDGSRLLVNFVTSGGNARMYNCANTATFKPTIGMTGFGMGLSGHLARVYIKIAN